MTSVKVGCARRQSKTTIIRRQVIDIPHEDGFPVPGDVGRARNDPVKAPNRLHGEIRGHADLGRLLDNSVQLLWGKQGERLMKACPAFTTGGVWGHGRCRVQRRDRLLNWHDGEWFDERTSQRAYRIVIGDALARVAPSSA